MPSQFPKIEEIVLPESLQGKLDSEPLEDLLEFEEVHMQHSYLRAVRSTPPGRWDPPLSRREDKEKIEELNDLAEVELRRLYQGLLSAESRGERAEEEKIAMIAGNLPDSLDTYVLKEIITKDPLEVEPPGGDSLLPWRSKEARLFRMYLEGSDRSFEYKKDKIIGIKEKFSSASNRDVAAAAECSYSYAKKFKQARGGKVKNRRKMGFTEKKKREIKRRDGHMCIACGSDGQKKLYVHHIDGDRENNEGGNLVTLCFDHHTAVETALDPFHLRHPGPLLSPWQYPRYREEAEEGIEAINDREDLYTIGLKTKDGEKLSILPEPEEAQNESIRVVVLESDR